MRVRIWIASLAMLLFAGCATTPVSEAAICDGTAASQRALASALLIDGGDQSRRAGLRLLDELRAGCGGQLARGLQQASMGGPGRMPGIVLLQRAHCFARGSPRPGHHPPFLGGDHV